MGSELRPGVRVGFVTGATPDRWAARWRDCYPEEPLALVPLSEAGQEAALRRREVDAAFVRLPLQRDGMHVVRLYDELPVVVLPNDHVLTAYDLVDAADLVHEQHLLPPPDGVAVQEPQLGFAPASAREAVELVATGVGVVVLPMSVARLHHRKDVTHRQVDGVPPTTVALAWLVERDDEQLQRLVGVVRGRTPRSSRG